MSDDTPNVNAGVCGHGFEICFSTECVKPSSDWGYLMRKKYDQALARVRELEGALEKARDHFGVIGGMTTDSATTGYINKDGGPVDEIEATLKGAKGKERKVKTYVRFFYPGIIMSETSVIEVKDRSTPDYGNAYGWQFFERECEYKNGEELLGKEKNHSPTFYVGKEFSAEEALKHPDCNSIMRSNVEGNGFKRLVKTIRGNWQPLRENDVVIKP